MESVDDAQEYYNLDMDNVSNENLKVIVQLDRNILRVLCEGPCDEDKWRAAYVSYWRRKIKNQPWKLDTRNSLERVMEI